MGIKTDFGINSGLIILLVISFIIYGCNNPQNLTTSLNDLGVNMDLEREYKIKEYKGIVENSKTIKIIFAISNKNIAKIRIIPDLSAKEAVDYINIQRYLVDSLFNEQKVPYPGPLSNTLKCPEKYLPKIEEEQDKDSWRVFYYLYANSRLTFGGCTDDILDYAAVLAFIYCKEKNEVYQIEYFTPKENPTPCYKEVIKSFRCGK